MTHRTHLVVGGIAFAMVLVGMALVFRSATYTYDTERAAALEVTLVPALPQRTGNRLEMRGPARSIRVICSQDGVRFEPPVEKIGDRFTALLDFPADGTWTIEVLADGSPAARYVITIGTPGLTPTAAILPRGLGHILSQIRAS